jgi:hypothetical protein
MVCEIFIVPSIQNMLRKHRYIFIASHGLYVLFKSHLEESTSLLTPRHTINKYEPSGD